MTADGIRVRQALDNLIGNAILYGRPDGHVHVTLEESGRRGRGHVADDGEGIDAEEVARCSTASSVAPTLAAPGRGSRSGLSIVRTIVEAHGGDVSVTSAAVRAPPCAWRCLVDARPVRSARFAQFARRYPHGAPRCLRAPLSRLHDREEGLPCQVGFRTTDHGCRLPAIGQLVQTARARI